MSEPTTVDPDQIISQLAPAIEVLLERRKQLIQDHLQELANINNKLEQLGYSEATPRGRQKKPINVG